jgi:hypothetical protein
MNSPTDPTLTLRLTLWLNAWQQRDITGADAANACETITDYLDITWQGQRLPWLQFLATQSADGLLCRTLFPAPGNPDGVPVTVLPAFASSPGVVAVGSELLIGRSENGAWLAVREPVDIVPIDLSFARLAMLDALQSAQKSLAELNLAGTRVTADTTLAELDFGYVPPSTAKRTLDAVEQAYRIATIARIAKDDAIAIASRSANHEKVRILDHLESCARQLLKAAVSSGYAAD